MSLRISVHKGPLLVTTRTYKYTRWLSFWGIIEKKRKKEKDIVRGGVHRWHLTIKFQRVGWGKPKQLYEGVDLGDS